ncbi:LOB domain-containing protein 11-like [Tripterygium wilfordii]|uniref:LOB domain-containing protein 11-like n=1 Tax=Tripterygium wilfordii TaxID=458696 RepID=A0A7J7BZX2_TRIWF|nr:LOB domain-containing protein 11-like [Tripterygium wilfordii]KAF5727431.1 LOB domain-containing protein 11-like [Tripterygium wilfordii]
MEMEMEMENSDTAAAATANASSPQQSNSPKSSPSSPSTPLPHVVISPCAACKILRRRCAEKCVLAPYFPPTEPAKFTIAHRVFGASNIIKFLQELPESQRADAVSSMVYEASARIRDPVYGCAGAIFQLQKQVVELQAQLAKAQAEIANIQCQKANLVALIYMEMSQQSPQPSSSQQSVDDFITSTPESYQSNPCFLDDNNLASLWEPLWT